MMTRIRRALTATLVVLLVVATAGAALWATVLGGVRPSLATRVSESVSIDAIMADLATLQRITDENDGTRAGGTPGQLRAAEFVAAELREAGYGVRMDVFSVPYFHETGQGIVSIGSQHFRSGADFRAMIFSAAGELSAPLVPVDFDPDAPPDEPRGVGCRADDLDGVPAGVILLVQGGGCAARDIVDNAVAAGAVGLVISYPGWRTDQVRRPTLRSPDVSIPVIGATHRMGVALAEAVAADPQTPLVVWSPTEIETRPSANVIAETPGGDPSRVVMLGGHLDSVIDGPGMNDNGSGVMTVLEVARRLAAESPERKVRVAFWTGEEIGVYGSLRYVNGRQASAQDAIDLYLNLDMLGSPNGGRIIYDEADAAPGSEGVADRFRDYFDSVGLAWISEDLGGGSDHYGFQLSGVPTGGLFSGASEVVGGEEADHFGIEAGRPYDACYHLTCDRLANVDAVLLGQMARAAGYVAALYASGEATARE
jgi:aminopeptidase Y